MVDADFTTFIRIKDNSTNSSFINKISNSLGLKRSTEEKWVNAIRNPKTKISKLKE